MHRAHGRDAAAAVHNRAVGRLPLVALRGAIHRLEGGSLFRPEALQ